MWLDRGWSHDEVDAFVCRLARVLSTSDTVARAAVFSRAVHEGQVLELPPHLAAETILLMLCAFSGASSASLWTLSDDGRLADVVRTGDGEPTRRARSAAREAISHGRPVTSERNLLHALPVQRWARPTAALVFRCRPEERTRTLSFAAEAASALAPVLEFEVLLARNAHREHALTGAAERQLARLGFDLHDGPMQDIAALAQEVRLFRSQLAAMLNGHDHAELAVGRVDDIEARLVALDRGLRDLVRSLQSPGGLRVSVVEALEHEIEQLRGRTDMSVVLDANGDFDALTASQKIALLRVGQEALNNAREHSGARTVRLTLRATTTLLSVEIEDDGVGFDVEGRLVEAARAGRLGLVGMGERIRLLGGRFDVDSSPGGPTRLRAVLPRWRPLGADSGEEAAG
jgi:signal transduction histidine kinase